MPARMLAAGTTVVAGTSPGKGGQTVAGVPVFDCAVDAVAASGATVSVIFVPARLRRGRHPRGRRCRLGPGGLHHRGHRLCATSWRLPRSSTLRLHASWSQLPGRRLAGRLNVGIMPADIFRAGPVGLVSRSGTLTYLIVSELSRAGLGQSSCVGIGGDAVHGLGFIECLQRFEADPQTAAVVLIGEIGGDEEERAAAFVAAHMTKPVVAYLAGFSAPPGKQMGHAGAIISGSSGTAAAKAEALEAAGIPVAREPDEVPGLLRGCLGEHHG